MNYARSNKPAIAFSSNACEVCGKSRNFPIHEQCSKLKQKKYAAQRTSINQALYFAQNGGNQSERFSLDDAFKKPS